MHCLEKFKCPNGVDFPELLILYAQYTVSSALKDEPAEYKSKYKALSKKADGCTGCGDCRQWCEYHLDIPAELAAAHAALNPPSLCRSFVHEYRFQEFHGFFKPFLDGHQGVFVFD